MNISKKISKLRKELKLSTEEFGKKIGVTGRMVARWENNTSTPTEDHLNKIKEIYAIDLKETTVKKEKVTIDNNKEKTVIKEKNNLDKSDAKGLKTISKTISIIAKIFKVLLLIAIPFLVILMIIIPAIVNNTEIGDNYINYRMPSGDVLSIQGEDFSLSGKYTIRYKDEIETGEIKYDVLGEIAKNIKGMDKTKIIVFTETAIILSIASVIFGVVFFTYLSKLFKNISLKTPFTEENIIYLKKMTNYLIADIVVSFLLKFILNIFINKDISSDFNFTYIIIMLCLASLIYIFKYGYNLQKNINSDIY